MKKLFTPYRFLVAAVLAVGLLWMPFAQAATVFPPVCSAVDPASSVKIGALGWDFVAEDDVRCIPIPTCDATTGLNFDGQSFFCSPICAVGEAPKKLADGSYVCCAAVTKDENLRDCPSPYTGTIVDRVTYNCDGTVTTETIESCLCDPLVEKRNERPCPDPNHKGSIYDEYVLDCDGIETITVKNTCYCPTTYSTEITDTCPEGEVGSVYKRVFKDCYGTVLNETYHDTCHVYVQTPNQCTVGQNYCGLKEGGSFTPCAYIEDKTMCKNYKCQNGGGLEKISDSCS